MFDNGLNYVIALKVKRNRNQTLHVY